MEDLQMTTANNDADTSIFGDDTFGRLNIFTCVSIILVILTNAFLMIAIFLDRKSHGKTRSLSLLNYMLNYALFALFIYFQNIHVYRFRDLPTSTCAFFVITHYVLEEGSKYFLFPICCDFIVKYFLPSKYESQKFLTIQYAMTGILWAFLWVLYLAVMLTLKKENPSSCFIYFENSFTTIINIFSVFVMIALLVFIGVLIYIAVRGKQCEMMKSPLRTLIVVLIFVLIFCLQRNLFALNIFPLFSVQMFINYWITFLVCFLLLPFIWLFDATIRQSVRKLWPGKCKESTDHPSHEKTELN
ncbi:uncharacterized protein LOC115220941 isoform X2 [Octopus sinensis]|uniref:Uncharacterized protein LOC115220941 isoform X2 n=1 Tax=Octopus sinensis TaxID=2607531 RepID=A0A7E6FFF5_9MOLL|nr:uncharacterized protein LOC115220941 isoform X2 [Octopus sinensis]